MAAIAFKIQHRVDHVFNDARTGDCAVLCDVADHDHGHVALFGECGQLVRRRADLGYRPRCAVDIVGPHGLNRINDREVGFFSL